MRYTGQRRCSQLLWAEQSEEAALRRSQGSAVLATQQLQARRERTTPTGYGILELQGDSTAFERVIAPYLVAQRRAEDLPLSSVIITPRNYKFRYAGRVETGDNAAYMGKQAVKIQCVRCVISGRPVIQARCVSVRHGALEVISMDKKDYDLVVIGGGPAGIAGADTA